MRQLNKIKYIRLLYKMNFENYFEKAELISLKNQKVGKTLQVNLIKLIKTKFGNAMIIYDKKHNITYYSNSLLKAYLNKLIENLKNESTYYYIDEDLSTILSFKIESIKNVDGKIQVQLEFNKNKSKCSDKVLDLSSDDESDESEDNEDVIIKKSIFNTKINKFYKK